MKTIYTAYKNLEITNIANNIWIACKDIWCLFMIRKYGVLICLNAFFNDPIRAINSICSWLNNINVPDSLDTKLNKIATNMTENGITLQSICTSFTMFILCYAIFKYWKIEILKTQEYVFFKQKTFTLVFTAVNVFLVIIASQRTSFSVQIANLISCFTGKNIKIFIFSILISIALAYTSAICVIVLPKLLIPFSVLFAVILTSSRYIFNYTIHDTFFYTALVTLLCFFLAGFLIQKYTRSYLNTLKSAVFLTFSNTITLFLFTFVFTLVHYALIKTTTKLWNTPNTNTVTCVFIMFMNALVYFFILYLMNVFVASLFQGSITAKHGKSTTSAWWYALSNTYQSLEYICYCAAVLAVFQTVVSILESLHDSLSKYQILIWKILAYLLYIIIKLLKMIIIFIDMDNKEQITLIGILGIEEYFKANENKQKLVVTSQAYGEHVLNAVESTPHVLLSIFSVATLNFYFFNANLLLFTGFCSCCIFTFFVNSIFISQRVICYNKEKTNKE